MNIDPLSSQIFIISRDSRDATVVIRGYVYQVQTTLLKWIEQPPDQRLELEAGEDIDVVSEALKNDDLDRVFQAVKHGRRNLSLRSPEALAALAGFQGRRV
jgi:hypothetical protein